MNTRLLPLLLALSLLGTSAPAAAGPWPSAQKSSRAEPTRPARPVITAENRLVLMPYGRYSGKAELGTAQLELREDQTFVLSWQVPIRQREGQLTGTFEWLKNAAGFESLAFWDVREAINGTLTGNTSDRTQAVLRLDRDLHHFTLSLPDLGEVSFKPTK